MHFTVSISWSGLIRRMVAFWFILTVVLLPLAHLSPQEWLLAENESHQNITSQVGLLATLSSLPPSPGAEKPLPYTGMIAAVPGMDLWFSTRFILRDIESPVSFLIASTRPRAPPLLSA